MTEYICHLIDHKVAVGLLSSHCDNFGYRIHGIIICSIRTQNGCTHCTHKEKVCEVNNF